MSIATYYDFRYQQDFIYVSVLIKVYFYMMDNIAVYVRS
jgi:hypothetical protein